MLRGATLAAQRQPACALLVGGEATCCLPAKERALGVWYMWLAFLWVLGHCPTLHCPAPYHPARHRIGTSAPGGSTKAPWLPGGSPAWPAAAVQRAGRSVCAESLPCFPSRAAEPWDGVGAGSAHAGKTGATLVLKRLPASAPPSLLIARTFFLFFKKCI